MKRQIVFVLAAAAFALALVPSAMAASQTGVPGWGISAGHELVMAMQTQYQKYVGQTRDALVKDPGQPTMTFTEKDGSAVLRHEISEAREYGFRHLDKDFTVSPDGKVMKVSMDTR
jgi:hypothetical protein